MILLLEDDNAFREALEILLECDGHSVLAFPSPANVPALDTLRGLTALIVDFEMPTENGLSFADRFHEAHPHVPVIMVSAHDGQKLETAVAQRKYLTVERKPVEYERIAALLPPGLQTAGS